MQAALLRKCCHEPKDQIDRRGLRLKNAVVAGCLNLAGLAVPFPLRYDGYEFGSALVVEGAEPLNGRCPVARGCLAAQVGGQAVCL